MIPSFPANLQVGDIKTARITITNSSTTPNNTEIVSVNGIFLTPSCAASDGATCSSADPGVFQFGTMIGATGSSCAGIPFTRGAPDLNGEFELIPSQPVFLGPSNNAGPLPRRCVILMNFQVVRAPVDSTPPNPPLTTDSLARANLQGVTSGSAGVAAGGSRSAITPVADLFISKTDGQTQVQPNSNTIYTVTVQNNGPSEVTNATVVDAAPAGVSFTNWTCAVTNPGAGGTVTTACGAATGMGDLNTTATLKVGGVVTYTITALVTANSGTFTNTASVTPPAGTSNSGTGCVSSGGITRSFVSPTCSSSDTNGLPPVADVSVTKTDGVTTVSTGTSTTYTIVVSNAGPSAADGAVVKDPATAGLSKTAAACTASSGGAACPAPQDVTVAALEGVAGVVIPTLPSGGTVTFTITADVTADAGSATNTVTANPPAGTNDPTPGNNTASDTDTIRVPTSGGQITPTEADCASFRDGTVDTLGELLYHEKGANMGPVNPGAFFYWTKVTTTVANQVVTVSQSHTGTVAVLTTDGVQMRLWALDCESFTRGTINSDQTGASWTVPTPGTYVIGIRYQSSSLTGTPLPVPATVTYTFTTNLPLTDASVVLAPHP